MDLPLVSVVTPSYNQAQFLDQTIRSVLSQTYPRVEYIILDGGSTDQSVEIIKGYADQIAFWVSEPDRGQSDAINKGLRRSRGEIVAWLNSDDRYHPWTVQRAVDALLENPRAGMVHGHHRFIDEDGKVIQDTLADTDRSRFDLERLLSARDFINQPTVFIRRSALEQVGLLRDDLHYAMDYELWIRLGKRFPVAFVNGIQADYRLHTHSKTTIMPFELAIEKYQVSKAYGGNGLQTALGVLNLRWIQMVKLRAQEGPGILLTDASSTGFQSLPADVQRASKEVLVTVLLDGAYICMRNRWSGRAVAWLAAAASRDLRRTLTRGTVLNYIKTLSRKSF